MHAANRSHYSPESSDMFAKKNTLVARLIVCMSCAVFTSTACWADDGNLKSLADRIQRMRAASKSNTKSPVSQAETNPTYQKIIQGLGLVEINTDEGTVNGTAWVLDREQRLMVTNHHVIEGYVDCYVYFPSKTADGKWDTNPATALNDKYCRYGRVVDSDQQFDLALIQLEDELPEGVVALQLAAESASPGTTIHSIAGSTVGTQSLWTYSTGHVRQAVRGTMANGYEAMLLESDIPTNQGNSGGPVCNEDGEVVAVVEGLSTEARLVSMDVELQSLVEYLSDALRCVNPETVEDFSLSAQRHMDEGRTGVAAKLVTKALQLEPNSAKLLTLRGWCWYWTDDEDSALGDFKDALKINGRLADAHYGIGCVHFDRGEYEEAIPFLTDAIRNDPDELGYRITRGDAYRNDFDYESAAEDFNYVLRSDSERVDASRLLGMTEIDMGECEQGVNRLAEVIEYFEDAELFYYAAWGRMELGINDDALTIMEAALQLDPEHYASNCAMGKLLLDLGRPADALQQTTRCLELGGEDDGFVCHYHGIALCENGRRDEGLRYLKKATELYDFDESFKDVYETYASQVGPQESDASEVEANQVSLSDAPVQKRQVVGKWRSNFEEQGVKFTVRLEFLANGRMKSVVVMTGPDGTQDVNTAEGAFQIVSGNKLLYWRDGGKAKKEREIRWYGDALAITDNDIDFWMIHHRVNES